MSASQLTVAHTGTDIDSYIKPGLLRITDSGISIQTEMTSDADVTTVDYEELLRREIEIFLNFTAGAGQNGGAFQTSISDDPLSRPAVRAAVIAVFAVVIVIGVVTNSVVLYVVIVSRRLRNVTNVFIGNLAASDMWLCGLSLPVQLHYQLTEQWAFGPVLCRVVFAAFAVPMYSSILSILWIAVDRYRLIVCPLRPRWSTRIALTMIVASVVLSLLVSVPVINYTSLHVIDESLLNLHKSYCIERWPSAYARRIYSLGVFVVQFCLPLTVTTCLYQRIYVSLTRRRLSSIQQRGSAYSGDFDKSTIGGGYGVSKMTPEGAPISVNQNQLAGNSPNILAGGLSAVHPGNRKDCSYSDFMQPSNRPAGNVNFDPACVATAGGGGNDRFDVGPTCSVTGATMTESVRRPKQRQHLRYQQRQQQQQQSTASQQRHRGRRTTRTSRLLFAIVANFVAFWLPWNLFSLVVEFDRTAVSGSSFRIIDLGLKVFALAGSACVNPFFYCWFNENFRIELAAVVTAALPIRFLRDRCRRSSRSSQTRTRTEGFLPAAALDLVAANAVASTKHKPTGNSLAVAANAPVTVPLEGDTRQQSSLDDETNQSRWCESSFGGILARSRRRRQQQQQQQQRRTSLSCNSNGRITSTGADRKPSNAGSGVVNASPAVEL